MLKVPLQTGDAVVRLSWTSIGRGCTLRDKLLIAVYATIRFRPGAWKLIARATGNCCWVVRIKTPMGPARLIFDILQPWELSVVDELIFTEMYLVSEQAEVLVDCGAFEPQRENFEVLQRRLEQYLPGAVCRHEAVGASRQLVSFSGFGVGGSVGGSDAEIMQFRLSDLPDFRGAESLLLKLDVEGAEAEILPDLLPHLPRRCRFLLETYLAEGEAEKLIQPYESAGFSSVAVRSRKHPLSGIMYIDWDLKRE
jgi:FkbM family methyltransferase